MNDNASGKRPAVLVADDDPVCRFFCVSVLSAHGYQTFEAGSGTRAVQTILRERPGVILADMHLPDMSGAEALSRVLHEWPDATSRARFAGISGDVSAQARAAMRSVGFCAFLDKPFTRKALLDFTLRLASGLNGSSGTQSPCCLPAALRARQERNMACHPLQDIFHAQLGSQLAELDRALTALDWRGAAQILHRQCGAAALAGYSALAGNGRQLLLELQAPHNLAGVASRYLDFLDQAGELSRDRKMHG